MIAGNEAEIDTAPSMAIPGAAYVAETLKDTMDAFMGAFGVKSKNYNEASTKTASKCGSCGASISVTRGQIVHCQYCDADQQLLKADHEAKKRISLAVSPAKRTNRFHFSKLDKLPDYG